MNNAASSKLPLLPLLASYVITSVLQTNSELRGPADPESSLGKGMALACDISVSSGKQTRIYLGHKVMITSQLPPWQCCVTSAPGSNTQLSAHSTGQRLAYRSAGSAALPWTWAQAADRVPDCATNLSPSWTSSNPACAQFRGKPSRAGPFQASAQGSFTSIPRVKERHTAQPKVKV